MVKLGNLKKKKKSDTKCIERKGREKICQVCVYFTGELGDSGSMGRVATKIQQAIDRKIKKKTVRLLNPLPSPSFPPVLSHSSVFLSQQPHPIS